VSFGAIGKLLAVVCGLAGYFGGLIPWKFAAFLSADVIFALLFFDYLRRTAHTRPASAG
jgi:hypothetical protein